MSEYLFSGRGASSTRRVEGLMSFPIPESSRRASKSASSEPLKRGIRIQTHSRSNNSWIRHKVTRRAPFRLSGPAGYSEMLTGRAQKESLSTTQRQNRDTRTESGLEESTG